MGWFSGRLPPPGAGLLFWVGPARAREVFPPEPLVAIAIRPQRRATVKGATHFWRGEANPLDGEHRVAPTITSRSGVAGTRSCWWALEQVWFGTAGPDDSPGANATIDHSENRGSEPPVALDVNLENQGPTALGADGKPRPLIQYQDLHNGHPCAGAVCDSR